MADGTVKCIDDEIPFEIPISWEWSRLINLIKDTNAGKSPNCDKSPRKGNQWGVLTTTAIQLGSFLPDENKVLPPDFKVQKEQEVKYEDILITRAGPRNRTGIVCVVDKPCDNLILSDKTVRIDYIKGFCNPYYLMDVLNSPGIHECVMRATVGMASSQVNISQDSIKKILIPVPPRKEQSKIVDILASIQPIIERYEKAQTNLDNLNFAIKGLLRKSILQEAIQGKLVPQIASEGDASILLQQIELEKQKLVAEGKLKKKDLFSSTIFRGDDNKYYENVDGDILCIDDEIPFSIPSNWAWCRLYSICSYIHRGKSPKYSLKKEIPVIAQKCNQWSGFTIEKAQFIEPESIKSYNDEHKLQDGDLLWNSTGLGTLGRMAIYESRKNPYGIAVADSHVTVIRTFKEYALFKYLYAYFTSPTVQNVIEDKSDGSTKQKELATRTVMSYLVPLPPLEEQKRIIDKIDRIVTSIMSR